MLSCWCEFRQNDLALMVSDVVLLYGLLLRVLFDIHEDGGSFPLRSQHLDQCPSHIDTDLPVSWDFGNVSFDPRYHLAPSM